MGRETPRTYGVLVPFIGALITLMSGVNSRLAGQVGNFAATLVIHAVGLLAVCAICVLRREETQGARPPAYYYLGGFVGVGTVFASIYAFQALGASVAVALALLGQTLYSIIMDATGFLGRKKYPLSVRRLPGIALAFAGVAVMVQGSPVRADTAALLIALAAGVLAVLSFALNSELGRRRGIFRSVRTNYLIGLLTTIAVIAALRLFGLDALRVEHAARSLAAAGPFLILGGGLIGVIVVSALNLVFPRVSAFAATLLLFSGQAFMGVTIDAVAAGEFDVKKLIGTVVLLAGLAVDALLSRRPARAQTGG
jgi:transporter family-2 protein